MSEEEKQMFNKMIYCNLINGEQALKFNRKYEDLQQKVEQLMLEIDRLNNIINELENDLKKRKHTYENMNASINGVAVGCFTYVLKKLQELKDSD